MWYLEKKYYSLCSFACENNTFHAVYAVYSICQKKSWECKVMMGETIELSQYWIPGVFFFRGGRYITIPENLCWCNNSISQSKLVQGMSRAKPLHLQMEKCASTTPFPGIRDLQHLRARTHLHPWLCRNIQETAVPCCMEQHLGLYTGPCRDGDM